MENYQVIIDPGHGGLDKGIIKGNYTESELTLALAHTLATRLKERGISVLLTRTEDECLTSEMRIDKIKDALIYSEHPIILSIHGTNENMMDIIYSNQANCALPLSLSSKISSCSTRCYSKKLPNSLPIDYYKIHRNIAYDSILLLRYQMIEARTNLVEQYAEELYDFLIEGSSSNEYLVQSGDTLWSIAKRNHLSVNELIDINQLTDNRVKIGQKLLIQSDKRCAPDVKELEYLAKRGENIYCIAYHYGVSAESIMTYNGLKSPCMEESKLLLIPVSKESIYKTDANENAYHVAKKYHISKEKLLIKNGITDGFFMYGEKISI